MKEVKTDRVLLGLSIAGFAVLAISFVLMPIEEMGVAPGILFWAGLLCGVVLQIVVEMRRQSNRHRCRCMYDCRFGCRNSGVRFYKRDRLSLLFVSFSTDLFVLYALYSKWKNLNFCEESKKSPASAGAKKAN